MNSVQYACVPRDEKNDHKITSETCELHYNIILENVPNCLQKSTQVYSSHMLVEMIPISSEVFYSNAFLPTKAQNFRKVCK